MAGFSRGVGLDACDRCGATGVVMELACIAASLLGECGERLHRTVQTFGQDQAQTYRCVNGHRYHVRLEGGAWAWTRAQDVEAVGMAVAL